jgi:hypothetical protein
MERGDSLIAASADPFTLNELPTSGQTPSRLAKLGPPRKLRIAAAGTAGSLPGVGILVGTKGRWAPTRRGCGSLICRMLVQTVCSTCCVRRSPLRTNINAVMTAMRRSSHSEALRSSRSFPTGRQHARCCGSLA